ncbi:MAG: hypothetical protein LBE35_02545 [Clostridiales bacterium]|jgi:hypothetical protein|nr:hypothetical protein [Clostridiales bacterium]
MIKFELILEAQNSEEQEQRIAALARIKYRLPSMSLYVVEVNDANLPYLKNVDGVKAISANAHISV